MKHSIWSANYLIGLVFLGCLFLGGNIAQLSNAPNTTERTSIRAANATSGRIAGDTVVGAANVTSGGNTDNTSVRTVDTLNGTVEKPSSTSAAGNISSQSGTGSQPNGTLQFTQPLVGSAGNESSGKASEDVSRVATNSSEGAASNSSGLSSSTLRVTTSNTISVSQSTKMNSSRATGGNTTPVSSRNSSRNSKANTVSSSAKATPTIKNSSGAVVAKTTPVSTSNATKDHATDSVRSAVIATPTVSGSVGNLSTVKPLARSSSTKPGKGSGEIAGKNSQNVKKPIDDSTVWPFDVSTEAITTEIPAPPPLEETDPSKKKKEKKPSTSLGPSLSADGKPCNESYRPHETDKSKYMQLESDGIWQRRECSPDGNLVWIQELCECGFDKTAENMIYEDACPSYKPDPKNKHGYLWQVHGVFVPMPCIESLVWSQKDCMCTWDESPKSDWSALANQKVVCQRILELKMDSDLSNSAARYEVKANSASGRGGISKIRFIHTIGATDNAAEIQNQPLTLDAFKGNDFQRAITFTLNFKILRSRAQSRTPMVLLTNGCIPDHTTLIRAPSINLSFTPGTNTFRVQFNTTETAIDETALAEPDQNGWFKTVLYFQDQTITLEVNGKKILSTNGMLGTIPKNLCPLLIGGSDIDKNQNFYGYLDNVNIIKDCKFHEANIKLL